MSDLVNYTTGKGVICPQCQGNFIEFGGQIVCKASEAEVATPPHEPLHGKVALVLDDRQVALNIGSQQGVTVGMRFRLEGKSIEIHDPDSGELLTTYTTDAGYVEVVEAHERIAICATYRMVEPRTYSQDMVHIGTVAVEVVSEPPSGKPRGWDAMFTR